MQDDDLKTVKLCAFDESMDEKLGERTTTWCHKYQANNELHTYLLGKHNHHGQCLRHDTVDIRSTV